MTENSFSQDSLAFDVVLTQTIARHFRGATTEAIDDVQTVRLGEGLPTIECFIDETQDHEPYGAFLFLQISGGAFGSRSVLVTASGYGSNQLESVVTAGCTWACAFGPVLLTGIGRPDLIDSDNPDIEPQQLNQLIEKVRDIRNAPIGVINLDKSLSIDKVTEIFIRINSKGASLTQADFVMSTIAADDKYGGNLLRKAIDYFCHLCTDSKFISVVNQDESFKTTEYYPMIKWAETVSKPLFTLTFDDLLRIAFSSRYYRGKMANLTDLLHGRNFDTRRYEDAIMQDTFSNLIIAVKDIFNKYNYDQFVECLTSAGFVHRKLIRGRMATDFAYTLFLRLRENKEIEKLKVAHYVQKWYVMSILTGRYTSSPETQMDFDLRSIREKGFLTFFNEVMANLSDSFWNVTLVQKLDTSTSNSPAFAIYLAAQCKNVDNSFLSNGAKVRDLLNETADNHHIFPRQYLKDQNMDNSTIYNQIANFVYLSRPVNIAIGKKAPHVYLGEIVNAINTDTESMYVNYKSIDELYANLRENCIPTDVINMDSTGYAKFLQKRRELMAKKIQDYFNSL